MIQLGRSLNLDIGTPNERAYSTEAGGAYEKRDDLGLIRDPKAYAKRRCRTCSGEGVCVVCEPVPLDKLSEAVAQDTNVAKMVHVKERKRKGKMVPEGHFISVTRTCACAPPRYQKARTRVLALLEKTCT